MDLVHGGTSVRMLPCMLDLTLMALAACQELDRLWHEVIGQITDDD